MAGEMLADYPNRYCLNCSAKNPGKNHDCLVSSFGETVYTKLYYPQYATASGVTPPANPLSGYDATQLYNELVSRPGVDRLRILDAFTEGELVDQLKKFNKAGQYHIISNSLYSSMMRIAKDHEKCTQKKAGAAKPELDYSDWYNTDVD